MPDELAKVARLSARAAALKTQRDEAIRAAVAAGHSLRVVGEAADLSHAAIARIVKRG